jgi:uncharacterized BrkB/YihY/UPF0761 family membrane protein
MKKHRDSDSRAIWAVAWRSFVFLPFTLLFSLLLLSLVLILLALPIIAAGYLFDGSWRLGAGIFAIWAALMWCYRYFRIGRFFESPPSLL